MSHAEEIVLPGLIPRRKGSSLQTMNQPEDAMETLAYSELLISCQVDGCSSVFQPTLDEPATDPVEEWACDMTNRARKAGWSISADGQVLCPTHGTPRKLGGA